MGIEPTQPAWKAGILAIELHPRFRTDNILTHINTEVNTFLPFFKLFFKRKKPPGNREAKYKLSVKNKLGKLNRLNNCIAFINTHITGSNFVNKNNFAVIVTKLKLNIP